MLQSYAMSGDQVVSTLAKEVLRLKQGIEDHRSNTGHGLCWLNDLELWKLLDSEAPYPHETIPMKEEFLHSVNDSTSRDLPELPIKNRSLSKLLWLRRKYEQNRTRENASKRAIRCDRS